MIHFLEVNLQLSRKSTTSSRLIFPLLFFLDKCLLLFRMSLFSYSPTLFILLLFFLRGKGPSCPFSETKPVGEDAETAGHSSDRWVVLSLCVEVSPLAREGLEMSHGIHQNLGQEASEG